MSEFNENCVSVSVNELYFSYFNSNSTLYGVNIRVNKSQIYGLLGSSGCGKTTLLKCILGRLKPKSGTIEVFGYKPGSPNSGIPGAGVGYMPQELGLYLVFNTNEIIIYFGRIFSMNKTDINEKIKEFIELLELPDNNNPISTLSGGQQKRVSLACALLHNPPLLILDEPTVGTDPSLRKIIFSYLKNLCLSGITIILTTHYIEETRNADVVAFLRNGKILVEENPNVLLNKYVSNSLEEVFLKLCDSKQQEVNRNDIHCYENKAFDNNFEIKVKNLSERKQSLCNPKDKSPSLKYSQTSHFTGKFSALLQKNFKKLVRNWILFIIFILTPVLQLTLLLYCIGDKPENLKVAIYNEEELNQRSNSLAEIFINTLNNKTFDKIWFDSFEAAIDSVKSGQTYAVIEINDRFSNALRIRALYRSDVDNETIDESQIWVHIDWSNQMIALQIERYLYETLIEFNKEFAKSLNINPESVKIPLIFEKPVYNVKSDLYREFVLPGIFIILSFFYISFVTAILFADERKDGILERSLLSGVTALEILLSHTLTQFVILCIQTILFIFIPLNLYTNQFPTTLPLIILLILSQGLCGTIFGIFVAVLTEEDVYIVMIEFMSFFMSTVLGGVFFPIDNIPKFVRFIGQTFPTSIPINSFRYLLYREWNLTYYGVYIGFIVTYVWLLFFLIITVIIFRRKTFT